MTMIVSTSMNSYPGSYIHSGKRIIDQRIDYSLVSLFNTFYVWINILVMQSWMELCFVTMVGLTQ